VKNDKGKSVTLLMPKVSGKVKFQGCEFANLQPVLQGVPIPKTFNAVMSAKELDCAIPNCTIKAAH
jgi:hypothetical protein